MPEDRHGNGPLVASNECKINWLIMQKRIWLDGCLTVRMAMILWLPAMTIKKLAKTAVKNKNISRCMKVGNDHLVASHVKN
jgi:hypothetical protein